MTTSSPRASRRDALLLGGAAGVLAASAVFLALPSALYSGNSRELAWPLGSILVLYWRFAFGLLAAFVLPAAVLPRRAALAWAGATAALALHLWAYGSFVVYDLGVIDGYTWRVESHPVTAALDFALVLAGLATAAVIARARPRPTAAILLAFAAIGGVTALRTVRGDTRERPPTRDVASFHRFSSDKNLLVVLLDSLQSDIFEEILSENPTLEKALEGFVFYPDTAGVSPSTHLAMPAIHAGLEYDGASSIRAYREAGVRRGSFLNALDERGYVTALVNPEQGLCPESVQLCVKDTELLTDGRNASLVHDAATLMDLTLLRVAPLAMKRSVYNRGRWRVTRALRDPRLYHTALRGNTLLAELGSNLSAAPQAPTAKFLHLFSTHLPTVLDARCVFTGETVRWSRANYRNQARCALDALRGVLDALRREQLYDRTVIVLLADHGTGGMDSTRADSRALPVGLANPTLAVKPLGARGAFRRSPELFSLADVPAIVCGALGDCSVEPRPPGAARVYHSFVWRQRYIQLDRVPGTVTYDIRGPLSESRSWRPRSPAAD